ncbi:MAG TPA: HAD family hydrolase [Ktedonobacterales bacterium]|jgi:phosphoglycolate phosphatase-like HAD superfamily hydrolase|nr:HAD family hydrolase [Ktedonobacterales bacterium]
MIDDGNLLPSWNATATRDAITRFVAAVTQADGPSYVPPQERVAVFDNDGTLWCEKPMPIQAGFILRRLAAMAEQDPALRERQPWKAAYEKDYTWLANTLVKHYQGDNDDLKLLVGGVQEAFGGMSVEEYEAEVSQFLQTGQHPTLGSPYLSCAYRPMIELLRYLEGNGFTTYIASGGDRDFMRPTAMQLYGIRREHVIGSSFALQYQENEQGGALLYKAGLDFFDDGPEKPVRIWSRVGRRPIVAAGNANGDIEMLQFAGGPSLPALRLLVLHDDADREFEYVAGAEHALERANAQGWALISVKRDWATVF